MSVWSFEAGDITDRDLGTCPIYRTPAIDEFLYFERSQKRIISGLKGTGKTLFLKLISKHYRELGGFTLIPATQLTERLYSIDYDFSSDKARAWASHERWKHVWRTVLSVVILKAVKKHIPSSILDIFPESLELSIGGHLSAAIKSREVNDPKFQELFPGMLDSSIQGINQPVALFLDNIDEAFARHSGHDLYIYSTKPQPQLGTHLYDIWIAAQLGFILTIRELSDRNDHLKLFGTVRTEAIRDNPTPTAFNIQAMVLDLSYTPLELRGIFHTKLEKLLSISKDYFPHPSESDPIKAFFPSDTIEHPTVIKDNGETYREDIFDYLRRHTRGRPRELDFIGYGLQMIPPGLRDLESIRELVRDLSQKFFQYAKNEAVPFWDRRLDTLLDNITSNFIERQKAEKIANRYFDEKTSHELWGALYSNGLCGAVVNEYPTKMVQRFSKHEGFAELTEQDFRAARIWVMHPCVNIATRPRRLRYVPNPRNVAGHGYEYEQLGSKSHLHVLVGAGKLGLGLVVPMILGDRRTKILIAARMSDEWQPLLDGNGKEKHALWIKYFNKPEQKSNDFIVNVKVITDNTLTWQKELRTGLRTNRCTLFLSSNDTALQLAISLGDSVGTSVGKDNLDNVATIIAGTQCKAKVVLGFENDNEALERARKILGLKGMTLAPVVVDRICAEREIGKEAIVVKAEPYGLLSTWVERSKKRFLPPVFLGNGINGVRFVADKDEFDFIREKKRRLVNSLHAAASALVQGALLGVGAKSETADDYILGLIASNMDISTELMAVKQLMILCVLEKLFEKKNISGLELQDMIHTLNDYGEQAIERILCQPDSPSRVMKISPQSLSDKYDRLFSDVGELARKALKRKDIKDVFQISEAEVLARVSALNQTFVYLFTEACRKKN